MCIFGLAGVLIIGEGPWFRLSSPFVGIQAGPSILSCDLLHSTIFYLPVRTAPCLPVARLSESLRHLPRSNRQFYFVLSILQNKNSLSLSVLYLRERDRIHSPLDNLVTACVYVSMQLNLQSAQLYHARC